MLYQQNPAAGCSGSALRQRSVTASGGFVIPVLQQGSFLLASLLTRGGRWISPVLAQIHWRRAAITKIASSGMPSTSGWKSKRLVLKTTGCSQHSPHTVQRSFWGSPASRARIQSGTAVKVRLKDWRASSHCRVSSSA